MKVYASKSGFPDPTNPASYDFVTTNNAVTIPGDGGRGYLASILGGGFTYAISAGTARGAYNPATVYAAGDIVTEGGNYYIYTNVAPSSGNDPATSSGFWAPSEDVTFDLLVEIDTVFNPARQYHPKTWECFSFSMDGSPWLSPYDSEYSQDAAKPVPQSGYCIFKVRATRLPAANNAGINVTPTSGNEISIVLGQNKLQLDGTLLFAPFLTNLQQPAGAGDPATGAGDGGGAGGTGEPFNLVIPANARDTGDVEVFIPVLGGNELVWQSDDDVIVEAWANWQPMFNFGYFARFPFIHADMPVYQYVDQSAVAYQFALSFTNFYDSAESNIHADLGSNPTEHVQFPLSVEIFNDLTACLNLIA